MGWHSFDQALLRAFDEGQVSEETAMLYCSSKGKFRRELEALKKVRGTGEAEGPSGLTLNMPAPVSLPVPARAGAR
jgi:hypothetical protein